MKKDEDFSIRPSPRSAQRPLSTKTGTWVQWAERTKHENRHLCLTSKVWVCRTKSTPTTIKRELSQRERTHRVSKHSNTHLKPQKSSLGNSLFSLMIFSIPFFHPFSSTSSYTPISVKGSPGHERLNPSLGPDRPKKPRDVWCTSYLSMQ